MEVALEELAQDLQAHLQTDEALQRAIVEVRRDRWRSVRGLSPRPLHFFQFFVQLLDAGLAAALCTAQPQVTAPATSTVGSRRPGPFIGSRAQKTAATATTTTTSTGP